MDKDEVEMFHIDFSSKKCVLESIGRDLPAILYALKSFFKIAFKLCTDSKTAFAISQKGNDCQ